MISWEFSIGWFSLGVLLVAAGAAVVVFHRQISYGLANGISSFDRVKLFGIIAIIIGLLVMMNLHTFFLGLLVNIIFKR